MYTSIVCPARSVWNFQQTVRGAMKNFERYTTRVTVGYYSHLSLPSFERWYCLRVEIYCLRYIAKMGFFFRWIKISTTFCADILSIIILAENLHTMQTNHILYEYYFEFCERCRKNIVLPYDCVLTIIHDYNSYGKSFSTRFVEKNA